MVEQPTDLGFRVGDEVLVPDRQHPPRQHGVPVRHEAEVGAVVATEVDEVVAEGLPFGEVLFEDAEAAVHRIATRVDDRRVRQDRVDEADVTEVVRQLVDEVPAPGSKHRHLRKVSRPQRRKVRSTQVRDGRRVAVAGRHPVVDVADEVEDVGQLHRALDFRVRGEDLLEQRRPRPGESHDEDRRRVRIADARALGIEADIEHRADALGPRLERIRIERSIPTPPGVAGGVVPEGAGRVAALFVGFTEREMPLRFARGIVRGIGQLRRHRGDLLVAEGVIFKVRQGPAGFGVGRLERPTRLVGRLALGPVAERLVHVTDRGPKPHLAGLEARRFLVGGERFLLA